MKAPGTQLKCRTPPVEDRGPQGVQPPLASISTRTLLQRPHACRALPALPYTQYAAAACIGKHHDEREVSLVSPLKELARSKPSDVPIFNVGIKCWLDSGCLRLLDRPRQLRLRAYDGLELLANFVGYGAGLARAHCPSRQGLCSLFLAEVEGGDADGSLMNPTTGIYPFWTVLIFCHAPTRSDRYGASTCFEMMPS